MLPQTIPFRGVSFHYTAGCLRSASVKEEITMKNTETVYTMKMTHYQVRACIGVLNQKWQQMKAEGEDTTVIVELLEKLLDLIGA